MARLEPRPALLLRPFLAHCVALRRARAGLGMVEARTICGRAVEGQFAACVVAVGVYSWGVTSFDIRIRLNTKGLAT